MNGFFLRGALAQGPICMTDDIIFGSALLECYQLESKASIVPRVILVDSLQRLVARRHEENPADDLAMSMCRDIDGWWFVNYLEAARREDGRAGVDWDLVKRHKQAILDTQSGVTRHEVLPKFGWACRYHNMFCHWHRDDPGYSEGHRIDRGVESRIHRLGDAPDA